MNMLLRQSAKEYARQMDMKRAFELQNERLAEMLDESWIFNSEELPADIRRREHLFLLLLAPLVEIAWADGRVTSRETEAILQAADAYGLVENEAAYCELMGTLLTRPAPSANDCVWERLRSVMRAFPPRERETFDFSLILQAEYVAGQSSNSLINFVRGERICPDERAVLEKIRAELKAVPAPKSTRPEAAEVFTAAASEESANGAGAQAANHPADELLPLVPLVKVAWAEGRITKRERNLIFEAAARMGVNPGSDAYARLLDWLELHPTEDFYESSLDNLRRRWEQMSPDEKDRERFSLLSECTLIAEASGGSAAFPAGGARISEEEIVAVKHIARRLGGAERLNEENKNRMETAGLY